MNTPSSDLPAPSVKRTADKQLPVPGLAYWLFFAGVLPFFIHCWTHLCGCGHLEHEQKNGPLVDTAWLALWAGSMFVIAHRRRKGNWHFYIAIGLAGFLSYGFLWLSVVFVALPLASLKRLSQKAAEHLPTAPQSPIPVTPN